MNKTTTSSQKTRYEDSAEYTSYLLSFNAFGEHLSYGNFEFASKMFEKYGQHLTERDIRSQAIYGLTETIKRGRFGPLEKSYAKRIVKDYGLTPEEVRSAAIEAYNCNKDSFTGAQIAKDWELEDGKIRLAATKAVGSAIGHGTYSYEGVKRITESLGLTEQDIHNAAIYAFRSVLSIGHLEMAKSIANEYKLTEQEVHSGAVDAYKLRKARKSNEFTPSWSEFPIMQRGSVPGLFRLLRPKEAEILERYNLVESLLTKIVRVFRPRPKPKVEDNVLNLIAREYGLAQQEYRSMAS